jgi:hypothetical protein
MKAGELGYFVGFDTFPTFQADPFPGSSNAVVAGYEGGLEVYSVGKRGLDHLASLKGLRGGVYNAKILPWSTPGDKTDVFPLVAVVVHGPVLPQTLETAAQTAQDGTVKERPENPGSPRPDGAQVDPGQGKPSNVIEFYQTSVEVYSLKTKKLVAVLLQAPKIPITTPITSPIFKAPPPTGALSIKADAGTILVSSGATGECWVYRQIVNDTNENTAIQFGCVGKLWTCLQQSPRGEVTEENDRSRSPATPVRSNPQTPIIALNGRWVAYCPAAPSSQIAMRAHVAVPLLGKAPGLASVTSPPLPSVTSAVDLPISEGVMNKIMRETTQELIQGAKWVGQQGMQAWNSYWNKSSNQQSPQQARSPPLGAQPWSGSYPPRHDAAQFPPTHGSPAQVVTKDPGLVSIVDVDAMGLSTALHSLTTFATPLGCSFLSFSPHGLTLFTASSKGDVQTVWDLMRIQFTKSSPLQPSVSSNNNNGPRVRQVAQFSRMTVARIVDVSWTKPNGERIAMVTERGTVHLLDMPSSAFTWPPPRRRRDAQEAKAVSSEPSSSAVSLASTAIGAAYEVARPLISRPRGGSTTVPGLTGSNIVDSASHGGRAIAASISNSLGKTGSAINQLRHTGENRVSLPPSTVLPTTSCVVWIAGRRHHTLYVIGDGLVRTFPPRNRRSSARSDKSRTLKASKYRDFKIPVLPNDELAPTVKHFIDADEHLELSDREMDFGNTVTLHPRGRPGQLDLSAEASIPQAEIESSAPYQPFHTDRRVALYEYATLDTRGHQVSATSVILAGGMSLDEPATSNKKKKQQQQQSATTRYEGSQPWAFGQPINAVKLDLGHQAAADEDFNTSDGHRALPASAMERVLEVGGNDEQIVVTTRRRRGARHTDIDEDGFFEDDCEVLDFADQRV